MLRRVVAAAGIWSSAVLGFLATVVAARTFSVGVNGDFVTVIALTGFVQTLLDLTAEESAIKYGFRYVTQERWGKLRRLLAGTLAFKLGGGALAALALVGLGAVWGGRLEVPLMVGAAIPLVQAPEGLAGAVLYLRGRYDVRSAFLALSMGLRLAAIAIGAPFGLTQAILAMAVAQALATGSICVAGLAAFRRFPSAAAEPLGDDRRDVLRFVLQSSGATGIVSLRTTLTLPLLRGVTSAVQASYFKIAQTPQTGFALLSAPARTILITEQTRDWERGARHAVMANVRRYTLLAAGVMAVVVPLAIVFMGDIVRLVFGAKYLGAVDAARLIVVASALQFLVGWSKSIPVAIGRPNLRIWTHGVESLVLLPLVVAFGVLWGATGAAAAVAVSSAVFVLMWTVLIFRLRDEVRRGSWPTEELLEPPAGLVAP